MAVLKPTVAIVGLGQMGGSLAAALTKRRLARVIGIARRSETVRRASRMGIVTAATTELEAVSEADVVVLAAPVRTNLSLIPRVLPLLRDGALLTDLGSTKTPFISAVRACKPSVAVVAGHPMAGGDLAGLDGCDPDLYQGRPWILIPAVANGRKVWKTLDRLVKGVGALPIWKDDSARHDLAVARISHIPYLLAYALCEQPRHETRIAGNSFRDATRVALSDVDMVLDFLLTNGGNIARAAKEVEVRLRRLVRLAKSGDEAGLRRFMIASRAFRQIVPEPK